MYTSAYTYAPDKTCGTAIEGDEDKEDEEEEETATEEEDVANAAGCVSIFSSPAGASFFS
jgi:hypothetical protein